MTYEETLSHIYGRGRFGMKPGLERIAAILLPLGNPHEQLTTVHVAGTNGKGSTASFLAAILAAAGLKVGLFTSPHLIGFTERIRVGGREIGEADVVRLAARVLAAAPAEATFFEIVTAMALLHFAEQRVEVAVMEAGMGGRFDATGVCAGVLTILTPVSLDHCAFLGEELTTIARDKAGLVRPGRPVVVAPQPPEVLEVFARQCRALASPCHRFGTEFSASWEEGSLRYRGMGGTLTGLRPGIGGNFQAVNAACALAGAELLGAAGFSIPPEAMRRGIEGASWPGRMEFFGEAPRLLLDGAHNPAAAHALAAALAEVPRERLILVLGVMGDKDAGGIIAPLLPLAAESVAVTPALDRAMPSAALAELCRKGGVACTDGGTVPAGLSLARSRAGAADLILVTGSLFTVGEARAFLLGRQFEPMRG